jgi:hypothetical protein
VIVLILIFDFCPADLSVNRKGVRSTATRARVKTSFLPRRLAPPQRLQGHSENTDEITHQEFCTRGRINYEATLGYLPSVCLVINLSLLILLPSGTTPAS